MSRREVFERQWYGVLAVLLMTLPAGTAAAQRSVAVLTIKSSQLSEDDCIALTNYMTVELQRVRGAKVLAWDDVTKMLEHQSASQALGCDDDQCMAEIGGALGVDFIVAGDIGKLGNRYLMNLKLIDIGRAETERRVSRTVEGDMGLFLDALPGMVSELMQGIASGIKPAAGARAGAGEGVPAGVPADKLAELIGKYYVEEIPAASLAGKSVPEILALLNDGSKVFDKAAQERFKREMAGSFAGVGAQIGIRDNRLTVVNSLPALPAARAGIQTLDRIVAIDGLSTDGMTVEQAVAKLRGAPASAVTLTVTPFEGTTTRTVQLHREVIEAEAIPYAGTFANVAYVRLSSVYQNVANELPGVLDHLVAREIEGLILDLRWNYGSTHRATLAVADLLLPRDKLVFYTKGRHSSYSTQYNTTERAEVSGRVRLAVLVNKGTGAGAEYIAAGIQDHDRGVVVGQPTPGTGRTHSELTIDDQFSINLLTAYTFRPCGRRLQKQDLRGRVYRTANGRTVRGDAGVVPDTLVPALSLPSSYRAFRTTAAHVRYVKAVVDRLVEQRAIINEKLKLDEQVVRDYAAWLSSRESLGPAVVDSIGKALTFALKESVLEMRLGPNHDVLDRYRLFNDLQFRAAMAILQDPERYERMLAPPQ